MKWSREFLVAGLIMYIDRISKAWALSLGSSIINMNGLLQFEYALNTGISWSIFARNDVLMKYLVLPFTGFLICFLLWQAYKRIRFGHNGMGEFLIIAGALSNLWDRIIYGGVIDFIALHYKEWFFPSFNIADMAICLGVLLMLIRVDGDIK
jgi:signal peptidase II